MKLLHTVKSSSLLLLILLVTSCAKMDLPVFLKRNTDALSFSYLHSTKDLAILANGEWKVSSKEDWISLSPAGGTGDGQAETLVKVTVAHNKGEKRSGQVMLSNNEKSFNIEVTQDDGKIAVGKPTMASGFVINKEVGEAIIQVPYTRGAADDQVNVKVTLFGPGAQGLSAQQLNNYSLAAGDGYIPVILNGTPTVLGEIQVNLLVEIPGRNISTELTVKSRIRVESGGLDPLESPTVTLVKVLPRLAVLDWGMYAKGSGLSRKFVLELAKSQYGPFIRRYANQVDWLSTTSIGTTTSIFFDHNRFAFADLQPNTTYWFRIVQKTINATQNLDSDVSYFQFTTPAEEPLAPNVLLYKDFDNFWWGGSAIYQAFGIQPTEAQILTNIDPASDAVKATDYRTYFPAGNLADAFSGNLAPAKTPAMWNYYWDGAKYGNNVTGADYKGWYGVNALPATGSIRLATASAQGYITTPVLEKIGEGIADITVTVNTAPYFEPYHAWGEDYLKHLIQVSGGGKITDAGPTGAIDNDAQVTVTCSSNVNASTGGPSRNYTVPTTHTVKISGATKNTKVTIKTTPYSGSNHYRIWVDDIKVVKN